jgi:hypothetical protein
MFHMLILLIVASLWEFCRITLLFVFGALLPALTSFLPACCIVSHFPEVSFWLIGQEHQQQKAPKQPFH